MQDATRFQESLGTKPRKLPWTWPYWTVALVILLANFLLARFVQPSLAGYIWTLVVPLVLGAITMISAKPLFSSDRPHEEGIFIAVFFLIVLQIIRLVWLFRNALFGI